MPGKLSTHVLDLTTGRPAAGMALEVWRLDGQPALLKTVSTGPDGRTAGPLLGPDEFACGQYEVVFRVGDYFARGGAARFLDRVPVRFHLTDPEASYHVPLLCTPWSYSTYRGS